MPHELNQKLRPCLGGQSACHRYFDGQGAQKTYNRIERKEVFREILDLVGALGAPQNEDTMRAAQAVWRQAVENWMQARGLIRSMNSMSVTRFSHKNGLINSSRHKKSKCPCGKGSGRCRGNSLAQCGRLGRFFVERGLSGRG